MYEKYWGLTTAPFQSVPDPNAYYPSFMHEEAITRIIYAIRGNKGGVLFTGEVGTGKTTVSRAVAKRLANENIDIGIITNPTLGIIDFLREILYQFGIRSSAAGKLDLIHEINDKLISNFQNGKKTVLMIDEAHLITDKNILEEIKLLLNFQLNDRFLLTLILIGQPELKKIIHNIKPLEQRITIRYHLRHFGIDDTKNYIVFRLRYVGATDSIFTMDAMELIHQHTDGVPRRINQLCDLSLLAGYFDRINPYKIRKDCVDAATVMKVLADKEKHGGL